MIVIFPIAGKAERFGGAFKPMLKVKGQSFLSLAYKTFDNFQKPYVFSIHTANQEINYYATSWLRNEIPEVIPVVIQNDTSGPLQTLRSAALVISQNISNNEQPVVVCDCDHWLDVDYINIMEKFVDFDVVLPRWKIEGKEINNWLVANFNEKLELVSFIEKPQMIPANDFAGIIGCYFFRSWSLLEKLIDTHCDDVSISDVLMSVARERITFIDVKNALFFGDKVRHKDAERSFENVRKIMSWN